MNNDYNRKTKWLKNFDERLHRRGRILYGGQCSVTLTSRQHCSRLQQRLQMPLNGLDTLQNMPSVLGDLDPHMGPRNHGLEYMVLWAHMSHPQTASLCVQPFLHNTPVWPIYRQTDTETTLRATAVAIGKGTNAMRPNNCQYLLVCYILRRRKKTNSYMDEHQRSTVL